MGSNPTPGQTYDTRYGPFEVLALRPAVGGILLRRADMRHVLVGLSDWERWNPRLPEGNTP